MDLVGVWLTQEEEETAEEEEEERLLPPSPSCTFGGC